jgi:hypothetical protein
MLGDQGPSFRPAFSLRQVPPPIFPPISPGPVVNSLRAASLIPSVRGIKIAENQSPQPQDRLYFSFSYFDDVNKSINRQFGVPFENFRIYREIFGFEKTFLDKRASLGLRLPLNTLSSESSIRGLGGTSTALGDLAVIAKYAAYWNRATGNLVTIGLLVNTPTGPGTFAGARNIRGPHNASLQPFVGAYYTIGKFYALGFSAIDVPTNPNDVTILYNDIGLGYYLYRDSRPDRLITLIAPTFETHVNTPLNHRGAFNFTDPAGTPDVVNLTFGVNVGLTPRGLLSVGYVTPVTGPRPFDGEFLALFNFRF